MNQASKSAPINPLAAGIGLTAASLFLIGGAFLGQSLDAPQVSATPSSTTTVEPVETESDTPANPAPEIQLPELEPLPPVIGEPEFPPTLEFPETTIPPVEQINEDDPAWDCRVMGNSQCGVQINGTWYVLDFTTGTFAERADQ